MGWNHATYTTNVYFFLTDGMINAVRFRGTIVATEVCQFHALECTLYMALRLGMIMQDPHMYFMASLQQQNSDVVSWLSKSPNLNPIEHTWDQLV